MPKKDGPDPKPVEWVGDSLKVLRGLPEAVKQSFGYAIFAAQKGEKSIHAKPMRGFLGSKVIEIVEDHDTDTYRAVYTVKFAGVVYVLHIFQKKSNKGISTPKPDLDLIKERLKQAAVMYKNRSRGK